MSDKVTNYKCPACTGPMYYDGEQDRLQCDYCGSSFSVAEIEELLSEKTEAAVEAAEQESAASVVQEDAELTLEGDVGINEDGAHWGAEDGMMAYNCPSCGAELICDETTAAMSCPYCDNPTIIPTSIADALKPDLIIPFKLDKEAAKAALRQHMKGKKLLPKVFSSENHIDEVKGVYVPFWLFDTDVRGDFVFSGTQVRTWSDRDFTYTETRFFELDRCGDMRFENLPVDASEQMDDSLMEAIEPFDPSQAVEFKNAYLAGYFANRYDVSADTNRQRANERIKTSVHNAFRGTTAGYLSTGMRRGDIRVKNSKARYAFYPVWILNTTWRGKKYTFAMNGQTGKFVGDLPIDKSLRWKWHAIYGLGFSALAFIISFFFLGI